MSQIPEQHEKNIQLGLHPFTIFQQAFYLLANIRQTLTSIPAIFKYTIPLFVLTVNILQLPRFNLLNSSSLSMDPGHICTNRDQVQWWRLWTFLISIDIGAGIWEVGKNFALTFVLGYSFGRVVQSQSFNQSQKSQTRVESIILEDETIVEEDQENLRNSKYSFLFWTYLILLEAPIITLVLSFINCFIWFVWTSFGPHTFVSYGLLPLTYFYFCYRHVLDEEKFGPVSLWFLPVKISSTVLNLLIGVFLMIFSMEGQSVLIITIYGLVQRFFLRSIYKKCRKNNN